jgi:DNA-binding IclR family transcriptional regulator
MNPPGANPRTRGARILAWLRRQTEPVTPAEFAGRWGTSAAAAYQSLSRYARRGVLVRVSEGVYQPTQIEAFNRRKS